ncbi:MAG: SIMPL domain-containing protein [Rikenellaceae bacterium]|nr:SIMPL domain-containing protein [Rikenellaceae bacterium]
MKRVILLFAAVLMALGVQAQSEQAFPSFVEVSSSAYREVAPNLVYLSITINERESKGRITVEEQERDMVAVLKKLGIDTKTDLRVSDLSSSQLKRSQAVKTKSYQLKMTDVALVGSVYIALNEIGITTINIENVTNTNRDSIEDELRVEAIHNARDNAKLMAEALDQTIGKAFYIHTYDVSVSTVRNEMDGVVVTAFGATKRADAPEPVITELRKIRISVQVRAKFVLE